MEAKKLIESLSHNERFELYRQLAEMYKLKNKVYEENKKSAVSIRWAAKNSNLSVRAKNVLFDYMRAYEVDYLTEIKPSALMKMSKCGKRTYEEIIKHINDLNK